MKQLKNCKHCNQRLTGRYKRFCGKPDCREASKKEHNEQCRVRNAKPRAEVLRKAKAKEPWVKVGECKICGAAFTPKNQRHVTCSPECAKERKRRKNLLRYEKRIPATHKAPNMKAWVGEREDDYTHKKYLEYKKQMKAENGRVCREDGCKTKCYGINNYYCERHRIINFRKAEGCAFLDEGDGGRRSASGVFG